MIDSWHTTMQHQIDILIILLAKPRLGSNCLVIIAGIASGIENTRDYRVDQYHHDNVNRILLHPQDPWNHIHSSRHQGKNDKLGYTTGYCLQDHVKLSADTLFWLGAGGKGRTTEGGGRVDVEEVGREGWWGDLLSSRVADAAGRGTAWFFWSELECLHLQGWTGWGRSNEVTENNIFREGSQIVYGVVALLYYINWLFSNFSRNKRCRMCDCRPSFSLLVIEFGDLGVRWVG